MSLIVFPFRAKTDCTNGGVTAQHDVFLLIDEHEPVPADARLPVLRIVRRNIGGVYVHAEPVIKPEGVAGPMAGGNFVHTSDSRWKALVGHDYPISVHDRFETWSDYDRNSR